MELTDEPQRDDLNRKTIRRALKDWDSVKSLGAHSLARLGVVEAQRQAAGYSDTHIGRGLALREVLHIALEALKPDDGLPEHGEKRWRPYIVLNEQYLAGRKPDYVAAQLYVSRRTYYNEQERALETMADVLCKWEEQRRLQDDQVENETETATARRSPFLAPPRPAHALVGRDDLLGNLKGRVLAGKDATLTALNGLPGVGKTTLAIELAHDPEVMDRFHDGVLWIGLGRQPDVLALMGTWATAVGIPTDEIARRASLADRAATIHAAIGLRCMLLVIDDAWRIEDALAFKIGGPNCAHIVTTRLTSIGPDFAGGGVVPVRELNAAEGFDLLAQLAPRAVKAEPEQAQELVRSVGGLPLALTLMGNHLRKQSCGGQSRRLRQALTQLQTTETRLQLEQPQSPLERRPDLPPDVPLSLQMTIGLSDTALSATARRAWRGLALFPSKPSTFSEAAALAVTAAPAEVLDTLVDYGLLENSGPDRYTMHQTIADYARLQSADLAATGRLVNYFVQYAETHTTESGMLDLELDNLLAAIEAAFCGDMHAVLIRYICSLHPFLVSRGLYAADERHLRRAYEAAQAIGDTTGLATILCDLGVVTLKRGQYADAKACLQESLAMARAAQSRQLEADNLLHLGNVSLYQGDYASARTCYEQARHIFRELGDRRSESKTITNLGIARWRQADYAGARACYEQARHIFRQVGDRQHESCTLNNLGIVAADQGDYVEAKAYYEQALRIFRQVSDRQGEGRAIGNLGLVATDLGDYIRARTYHEHALHIFQEIGDRWGEGYTFDSLGDVAIQLGDYAEARTCYEQALCICRETNDRQREGQTIGHLSLPCHHLGDNESACEYSRQSLLIAQEIGDRSGQSNALTYVGHALLGLGRLDEAAATYQQAFDLRRELGQPHLAIESLAGLARVSLAQDELAQAQAHIEEIMRYLETSTLDGTEEPCRIYQTCYRVLRANDDPRAGDVLHTAYHLLQERAAKISDREMRRSFLERIAAHREIRREFGQVSRGASG